VVLVLLAEELLVNLEVGILHFRGQNHWERKKMQDSYPSLVSQVIWM
jgi:hypothetical protein